MAEDQRQLSFFDGSLGVQNQWFHVLKAAIVDNKIAEMGTTAWAVYCVIKAHAHMSTGETWLSQVRIAQLVGKSTDTVQRSTERLIEMKMIERRMRGRSATYRTIESFPLVTRDGKPAGTATAPYIPAEFMGLVNQIKDALKTGDMPHNESEINITINVTNVNGQGATVNVGQVTVNNGQRASSAVIDAEPAVEIPADELARRRGLRNLV